MAVLSSQWEQPIFIKDSLGQDFCFIPKRTFFFGIKRDPMQLLGPFYMGKFPITNVQFKHFVDQTGYDYKLFDIMEQLSPDYGCPATPLSWEDAKAYCRWLRSVTNDYYSLPTEAEWELSSRGTDGRLYPWGNSSPSDKHGTFSLSVFRRQTNVSGKFPMNISHYGCIDMIGNAWEWCQNDWDVEKSFYVLRGGACINDHTSCNCVSRKNIDDPQNRILYSSFRLVYLPQNLYRRYCSINEAEAAKAAI